MKILKSMYYISDRKDLMKNAQGEDQELNEDEVESHSTGKKQTEHRGRHSIRTLLVNPDLAHQETQSWMGIEVMPSKTYELPNWMDDNTLGMFDMRHPLRQYLLEMLRKYTAKGKWKGHRTETTKLSNTFLCLLHNFST